MVVDVGTNIELAINQLDIKEIQRSVEIIDSILRELKKPVIDAWDRAKRIGSGVLSLLIASFFLNFSAPIAFARPTPAGLIKCTNMIRDEYGLKPLRINRMLSRAATTKAIEMVKLQYWSHENPETGEETWHMLDDAGYHYEHAGENLALGFPESDLACNGWKKSPLHLKNIIDQRFNDVGFSVRYARIGNQRGYLIVQIFGTTKK